MRSIGDGEISARPVRRGVIRAGIDRRDLAGLAIFLILGMLACGWQNCLLRRQMRERDQAWIGGWDDNHYLAWGRSLAVDGDLDFRNDFEFVASLRGFSPTSDVFTAALANAAPTETGKLPNKYAIGTGLSALPALMAARLACAIEGRRSGRIVSPFASIYAVAYAMSNAVWGIAGMAAAWLALRRRYGRKRAMGAVLWVFFGNPLFYYVFFQPTMAHSVGFAAVTCFLIAAEAWGARLNASAAEATDLRATCGRLMIFSAVMGLLLGAACLVRFNHAVLALAPVALALHSVFRATPPDRFLVLALAGICVPVAGAGAMIGFLPQMIAWKALYGHWLIDTYQGEALQLWPVHLLAILFGLRAGWFVWTPMAALGVWGLLRAGRLERGWAILGLAALAGTLWIFGGWDNYWLGDSFGMRGLVDTSFPLMAGVACLMSGARRWRNRAGRGLLAASALLCVLWNLHWTIAYQAGIQPHDGPLDWNASVSHWELYRSELQKDFDRISARKFPLFTPADPARAYSP